MLKKIVFLSMSLLTGLISIILVVVLVAPAKIDKVNYENNFLWINNFRSKEFVKIENKRSEVIYQIFPSSFADGNDDGKGDLIGVKNKIQYFKELGINAILFNPIFNSISNHRYDIINDREIDSDLGGMNAFIDMVGLFKDNNIKVYLDFVPNHSSNLNPYFKRWIEDLKNQNIKFQKNDYYIPGKIDFLTNKSKLWIHIPGTSKKISDLEENQYNAYFSSFSSSNMPDRNLASQVTTKNLINSAKFWIDKGVDGFRIDAVPHLFDYREYEGIKINEYKDYAIKNKKEAIKLSKTWYKYFINTLKEYKKDIYVFGETLTGKNEIAEYNTSMPQFNEPLYHKIFKINNYKFYNVANEYNELNNYYKEKSKNPYLNGNISFLSSHDKDRHSSLLFNNLKKTRTFRNYDNNNLLMKKLKLSYLSSYNIQFTLPDQPLIYYGEEIGLLGERLQNEKNDIGRRLKMPWKKNNGRVKYVGNDNSKEKYLSNSKVRRRTLFNKNDENKIVKNLKKDLVFKRIKNLIQFRNKNDKIWNLPFDNYIINNVNGGNIKSYFYKDVKNKKEHLFIINFDSSNNSNINLSIHNKKINKIKLIDTNKKINTSNNFIIPAGQVAYLEMTIF